MRYRDLEACYDGPIPPSLKHAALQGGPEVYYPVLLRAAEWQFYRRSQVTLSILQTRRWAGQTRLSRYVRLMALYRDKARETVDLAG